jgi:hypothetical protein
MPTYAFDPTDEIDQGELERATSAYEQGEQLLRAQEEDRASRFQQIEKDQEDVQLIGGKFKSQEDLLRAYKELESKLGKKDQGEGEEGLEEPTEASDEAPDEDTQEEEEKPSEALALMQRLSKEYEGSSQLKEEDIEELAKLDSKELIKSYIQFYQSQAQQAQAAQVSAQQEQEIKKIAGGEEAYSEMVTWAAKNLDQTEIDAFNSVTQSGNAAAIKFAVEALANRYKNNEGYEAPLVTGRKADSGIKPYRSQAELARDIANPMYSSDPAFRADVEERLARSTNLL